MTDFAGRLGEALGQLDEGPAAGRFGRGIERGGFRPQEELFQTGIKQTLKYPPERPGGESTDSFTYGGFLGLIPEEQRQLIGMSPEELAEHFGLGPEYAQYFQRIDPTRIQEVLGQIGEERGERLGMAQEQYGLGTRGAREKGQMGLLGLGRRMQAARAGGGFAGAGAVGRAGQIEARGLRAGYGQELGRLGQARGAQRFQAGQQAQSDLDRLLALITEQLGVMPETALRIESLDPLGGGGEGEGEGGFIEDFEAKDVLKPGWGLW